MRVHYLQHVPFEGLGSMESYLAAQGHEITFTRMYRGEPCPDPDAVDWLILMGGPMGIDDENQYPWLRYEKAFLKSVIAGGKRVLGICLGAQLIADALGARVRKNAHREIGWFPVTRSPALSGTCLASVLPEQFEVFHWHGDTFELPANALAVAESDACKNQGFIVDDRILALQFHLETTLGSARVLIENCRNELNGSRYVQTEKEILAEEGRFVAINEVMDSVLGALDKKGQ